jgi:chorismate mutase/prephenate dehydratase
MESSQIVAFQGEHGAYSEQVALARWGTNVKTRPCKTLRQVFAEVETKSVDYGIVPAENSLEGSINQTYDLLLETPLKICGEVKTRVSHCLLGLPETQTGDVRVVYSHPQALAQCSAFLESLRVEVEPIYDTAGGAKMVKEKKLRYAAAIAGIRAAELYGLKVLKEKIEDVPENFTRFFVIGWNEIEPTGEDKTSVVFGTRHVPGSLHAALSELASRRINLTKIESRPIKGTPWEYHFFVDFEGHQSELECSEALNALRKSTTFLKILGSYPRQAKS